MNVYGKEIEQLIEELNRELNPFYLVNLYNGRFSLCVIINEMNEEYGQAAFDAYAVEKGEKPRDEQGFITYGSGYDWKAAFMEAFKADPNIGKVCFDCEYTGFFCDSDNLDILADFGKRFRALCLDTEKFLLIVSAGMKNADKQKQLMSTVRGQLMEHPKVTFEIISPLGETRITPDMTEKLLTGKMSTVQISGVNYADFELLDQHITSQQTDLFDENLIRMKTEEALEVIENPVMTI